MDYCVVILSSCVDPSTSLVLIPTAALEDGTGVILNERSCSVAYMYILYHTD